MKNPFDVFRERKQQIENKKGTLQREINELQESVVQLDEKSKAAALSNDLDKYMQIKEKKERTAAAIELKQFQLENMEQVPESDILEGWKEYRDVYDKELEKAAAEMEKAKAAFCDAFRKLLVVQNNGLLEREKVGVLLGFSPGSGMRYFKGGGEDIDSKLPIKLMPQQAKRPVGYGGKSMRGDLALYLSENPDSLGATVIAGMVPVEREKI